MTFSTLFGVFPANSVNVLKQYTDFRQTVLQTIFDCIIFYKTHNLFIPLQYLSRPNETHKFVLLNK